MSQAAKKAARPAEPRLGYLFICGTPRSGTTAACHLLNRHPEIVVGIERYKAIYGAASRVQEIGPNLFDKERFFDFKASDSNSTKNVYEDIDLLANKFDTAAYRGDKLPRFYVHYAKLRARFKAARFIYLVRDPVRVASSWQRRAENERDHWPAKNDHKRAVQEWNTANKLTLRMAAKQSARLVVVNYDELFGGDEANLIRLLRWLRLKPHPEILRYYRKTCAPQAVKIQERGSALSTEDSGQVASEADWSVVNELMSLASLDTKDKEAAAAIAVRDAKRLEASP